MSGTGDSEFFSAVDKKSSIRPLQPPGDVKLSEADMEAFSDDKAAGMIFRELKQVAHKMDWCISEQVKCRENVINLDEARLAHASELEKNSRRWADLKSKWIVIAGFGTVAVTLFITWIEKTWFK